MLEPDIALSGFWSYFNSTHTDQAVSMCKTRTRHSFSHSASPAASWCEFMRFKTNLAVEEVRFELLG
jgi:hypothetical protein